MTVRAQSALLMLHRSLNRKASSLCCTLLCLFFANSDLGVLVGVFIIIGTHTRTHKNEQRAGVFHRQEFK